MLNSHFRAATILIAALIGGSPASALNFAERWKALYSGGTDAVLEAKNLDVKSSRVETKPAARRHRFERDRKWRKHGRRWRYAYLKRRR